MKRIIERMVKTIYPDVCPNCDKVTGYVGLCKECEGTFKIVKSPICAICGRSLEDSGELYCCECKVERHLFKRNISVFEYKGDIKECIYRFKYADMRCYSEYFASVADQRYENVLKNWRIDAIVPVPMYKKKQRQRGYNQAEEFAKSLSRLCEVRVENKLLIRRKPTAPMKSLSKQQRYENLKKAFGVNKIREMPCRVLIVDDIFTTGSTMDACARVLLKAGVKEVYGMCVATGSV